MPCFHPVTMWPAKNGGRYVRHVELACDGAESVVVGCGYCVGCIKRRAGEWVIRNLWELDAHGGVACFVTLTYANEHLPDDYSVSVKAMQRFMRRLRRRLPEGVKVRFFAVAEYGDSEEGTKRPHYHFIIYGWSPEDAERIEDSKRGLPQYVSKFLDGVWPYGRVTVGEVNAQSIGYCVGYIFDKRWGAAAEIEYANRLHPVSGEVVPKVRPPFNVMSRRPGIGSSWPGFSNGDALMDTVRAPRGNGERAMPRFVVRKRLDAMASDEEREAFKAERREKAVAEAAKHVRDLTGSRLLVREIVSVLEARGLARGEDGWSEADICAQLDEAARLAEFERSPEASRQAKREAERLARDAERDAVAREKFAQMEARARRQRERV